jgi:hypothetical protein
MAPLSSIESFPLLEFVYESLEEKKKLFQYSIEDFKIPLMFVSIFHLSWCDVELWSTPHCRKGLLCWPPVNGLAERWNRRNMKQQLTSNRPIHSLEASRATPSGSEGLTITQHHTMINGK